VQAGQCQDPPTGAVDELNGLTTPAQPGPPARLHAAPPRRNGWQPRLPTLDSPRLKADHHNHRAADADAGHPRRTLRPGRLTAPPRSGMALPLDSHVERQVTWSGTSCDRRSPPEVADSPRRRRFMVRRMVPSRRPTGPATLRNRCVCPVARSPAISAPRADEASAEGEPVAGSLRMHRQRTPLRHNTGRTPCRCKSREQAAHSRGQPD